MKRMTISRKKLAPLTGVVLAIAALWLYSNLWYSPAMRARIATPDGKPLAGAIVVANWNIQASISGASLGQLALAETVTDTDGWFHIPAWGPRWLWRGSVRVDEPTVRVFKPGFTPLVLHNTEEAPMHTASLVIAFRLQDQALAMEPFTGSPAEYQTALASLLASLSVLNNGGAPGICDWQRTSRLLPALRLTRQACSRPR
jgi:hypothetical protein